MKRPLAASVWQEGAWFVAQCMELDVASQGETEDAALSNLEEALELHLEPPLATRPTCDGATGTGEPPARTSPEVIAWNRGRSRRHEPPGSFALPRLPLRR